MFLQFCHTGEVEIFITIVVQKLAIWIIEDDQYVMLSSDFTDAKQFIFAEYFSGRI